MSKHEHQFLQRTGVMVLEELSRLVLVQTNVGDERQAQQPTHVVKQPLCEVLLQIPIDESRVALWFHGQDHGAHEVQHALHPSGTTHGARVDQVGELHPPQLQSPLAEVVPDLEHTCTQLNILGRRFHGCTFLHHWRNTKKCWSNLTCVQTEGETTTFESHSPLCRLVDQVAWTVSMSAQFQPIVPSFNHLAR